MNLYKDSYNPHSKQDDENEDESSVNEEEEMGYDAIEPPVFLGDVRKVSRKFQRKKRQQEDVSLASLISNTNMQTMNVHRGQGSIDENDDFTSQERSADDHAGGKNKKRDHVDYDYDDDDEEEDEQCNDERSSYKKALIQCQCGNDYCGLQVDSSNPPSLKACMNAKGKKNGKCVSGIMIFKDCQTKICSRCYYNKK